MTLEELRTVQRGDYVVVRYGRNGEQLMFVNRIMLTYMDPAVFGWIWRANGRRWTKGQTGRVAALVLRRATPADVKRFRPTPCLGEPFRGR